MHLPVPLTTQHGAGSDFSMTRSPLHRLLAGLLRRARAIQQANGLGIEVAEKLGLELVGQNTEQQMPGQVGGRLPPERRLSSPAKLDDAEIAQPRDLGIECLPIRRFSRNSGIATWTHEASGRNAWGMVGTGADASTKRRAACHHALKLSGDAGIVPNQPAFITELCSSPCGPI